MATPADDDFYVGYLGQAPSDLGRFVRRVAASLVIGGVGVAVVVALGQRQLEPATFEFGHTREFRGTVELTPYPSLRVSLPGTSGPGGGVTRLMLVSQGKHGAGPELAQHAHHSVQLEGTLMYRDGNTMLELVPHAVHADGSEPIPPAQPERLGAVTLKGEIVDAKCHLGAMIPGTGTVHRACAVRCLSGGIPPMLSVIDSAGFRANVWLTGPGGTPVVESFLSLVAEPVEMSGQLMVFDDQLVLEVDPATVTWIH
ncbi:MAG: hypothetical protein O7E49_13580 [Gemmatimonadetes bacterium]|nr:hypothetical protein [Gemmatimonadota bacterium]